MRCFRLGGMTVCFTGSAVNNKQPTTHKTQRGSLDLCLARGGETTQATRAEAHPPLQLSRVRHEAASPHTAALTLIHLGGVLAGDCYDMHVVLEEHAAAHITTAAATQIYRMPQDHAEQRLYLRLHANSSLEWLPEPTILFGGSDFRQHVRIDVAPNARLAFLDVLVPGRLARGEWFVFRRYESRLEIFGFNGRLLVAERFALAPDETTLATPGVLPAEPVVGSLFVVGETVDTERAIAFCAGRANLGATALPNRAGMLVRAVGANGSAVRAALIEALQTIS